MNGKSFSTSPLAGVLSLIVAIAASWLAVANESWAQTVLVGGVALVYLIAPPSGGLPRPILILFGVVVALESLAFLPLAGWQETIRRPLLEQGIVLPSTFSAQPWWSLENGLLLLASLLWAWSCFEAKFSLNQRKFLFAAFLIASGAVALASLLRGTEAGEALPGWLLQAGRFPNRNQTGDLLVMGGLGCFARSISDILNRKVQGVGWMVMTGLFAAAIVRTDSRAAAVLFGLGTLLMFVFLGNLRRHNAASWGVLALATVAVAFLFCYEGQALADRFGVLVSNAKGGRGLIYLDAFRMIARSPWLGVGLGNFAGFYNVGRVSTRALDWYVLHPESDWLWLTAELGVGGLIALALLVFWAFRFYLRESPFPVLTRAATVIALVFLIHSLFDVAGHRMGTAWSCLFLVGLGAFRRASIAVYRVPRPLLRFAGLALLILAALRAQSLGPEPWMPTRGSEDNLEARIVASRSSAEQKAWVDRAIAWSPLEWNLYFQRGLLAEETGQFRAAKEDFRRSLFLLPDSFTLPISIAEVCRGSDLNATMDAWREALRRSGPLRAARFRELFDEPNLDERTRLQMATLAGDDPEMQMIALVRQDRPDFEWSRENLLAANPTLAGVDPELERQFFDRWAQDGDAAKLDADWLEHPEWEAAGWRGHARALARVGLFDEAVEAALKELPAPKLPASRSMPEMDALKNYLMQPKDPFAGIELYLAQKAAGENDEALKTLQSVAALPDAPPFVPYLLAQGLLAAGQNEAAWNAIAPLLDRP